MKNIIVLCMLLYNLYGSTTLQNKINLQKINFTAIEKEYIVSHTITLGMTEEYYPFSFKENGKITGFSNDYINLIMEKSGLKINLEMDNWSNTLTKFQNKQIDLIDVISYKKERESYTNFSKPYFEIPNVIFARKGEINNYTGFESLKGKKVGITKNIYYYDAIKNLNLFELVEFEKSKDKMKALAYEEVDAIFNNLISGQKYIKKGGYSNIKVLDEIDSSIVKKEDLRIGVQKEDEVLFSIINKSMDAVTREEKEEIYSRWFVAKNESKTDRSTSLLTADEKEYLINKKEITMCIDPDWMPFEKIENGKHIGLASDYIQIAQKEIGIPIKIIQTTDWDSSVQKAKNRECDIFSMVTQTNERQKYMDFTSPYLDIPMLITTKMDKPFIDNIEQILDKKIGVVKSYAIFAILKEKYPTINLVEVNSVNDGLRQVESGNIFAFIDNLATINYEIQKRFIDSVKVSGRLDNRLKFGIATRNDEPVLHKIFEKIIVNIDINTKEKIFRKWINPAQKENFVNYTIVVYILIFVTILLILFIYRQYSLKKSNKILKKAVERKTHDLQKLNESLEQKIKEEVEKNFQIQKKLFKSEKMASMGEMIGNIAHQWRQPLSSISTGATGMKVQKEYHTLSDEVFYKTCDVINENAQYLSKTIDDFRNFIKGERKKAIFDISVNINTFLSLIEGSIKASNINIVLEIEENLKLNGYENELIQCYINIFNNSRDALQNTNDDQKYFFIKSYTDKNNVIIKIKDSGGGIKEDILSKIFEPYFTTKHKSQGTGLGLHMTYNLIVEGMEGSIQVQNVTYRYKDKHYIGAEFIIKLPIKR